MADLLRASALSLEGRITHEAKARRRSLGVAVAIMAASGLGSTWTAAWIVDRQAADRAVVNCQAINDNAQRNLALIFRLHEARALREATLPAEERAAREAIRAEERRIAAQELEIVDCAALR